MKSPARPPAPRLVAWSALSVVLGFTPLRAADATPPPRPPDFTALSATTENVAIAYIGHYFKMEFDAMERLAAENASFDGTTADILFGSVPASGRNATYDSLRESFKGVTRISFHPTRKYFSGEHAVSRARWIGASAPGLAPGNSPPPACRPSPSATSAPAWGITPRLRRLPCSPRTISRAARGGRRETLTAVPALHPAAPGPDCGE